MLQLNLLWLDCLTTAPLGRDFQTLSVDIMIGRVYLLASVWLNSVFVIGWDRYTLVSFGLQEFSFMRGTRNRRTDGRRGAMRIGELLEGGPHKKATSCDHD